MTHQRKHIFIIIFIIFNLFSGITVFGNGLSNLKLGYQENLNYTGGQNDPRITEKFPDDMSLGGYNAIAVSFAVISGTTVSWYDKGKLNDYGYAPYANKVGFLNAVADVHQKGGLMFATVGGDDPTIYQPNYQQVDNLADNLFNFLAANHMDGVIFDLEEGDDATNNNLIDLITQLRRAYNTDQNKAVDFPHGFYIIASPTYDSTHKILAWAGANGVFNDVAKQPGMFDAIAIMNYSYDTHVQKTPSEMLSWAEKQGYPSSTKFIIVQQANPKESGYQAPGDVATSLSSIGDDSNYAGFGLWSTQYDAGNNWAWKNISAKG